MQQHLQLQLLEKHRQLQAALVKQQRELQRISEQLILASQLSDPSASAALNAGAFQLTENASCELVDVIVFEFVSQI